jgi:hypothetical protein
MESFIKGAQLDYSSTEVPSLRRSLGARLPMATPGNRCNIPSCKKAAHIEFQRCGWNNFQPLIYAAVALLIFHP